MVPKFQRFLLKKQPFFPENHTAYEKVASLTGIVFSVTE
jgi:hypothetical protein